MDHPTLLKIFAGTTLETSDKSYSFVSIPVEHWAELLTKLNNPEFISITKLNDKEISLIVETEMWENSDIPFSFKINNNWRLFNFSGEGFIEIVGYVSKISLLLAQNNITIMTFSTYHMFHLLVKEEDFAKTQAILKIFLRQATT